MGNIGSMCELRIDWSDWDFPLVKMPFGLEFVLSFLLQTENLVIASSRENQLFIPPFAD